MAKNTDWIPGSHPCPGSWVLFMRKKRHFFFPNSYHQVACATKAGHSIFLKASELGFIMALERAPGDTLNASCVASKRGPSQLAKWNGLWLDPKNQQHTVILLQYIHVGSVHVHRCCEAVLSFRRLFVSWATLRCCSWYWCSLLSIRTLL